MADAPDEWVPYKPSGDEWVPYVPPTATETAVDTAKSAGVGVGEGAIGLAGLPGDVRDLAGAGVGWGAKKLGMDPKQVDYAVNAAKQIGPLKHFPSSADITKKVEGVTGEFYKPTTTWGEYARTLGNFVPGAAFGPAGIGRRAAQQVVVPGLASETAGQATKGTAFEPWARGATALVSPWAANRTANLAAPRQVIPNAEEIAASASRGYREVRALDVQLNPTAIVPVANRIEQDLLNLGLTERNVPEVYGVLRNLQNPPAPPVPVPGAPPPPRVVMTAQDFENARQELVQALYGPNGREHVAALHAIRAMDNYFNNVPAADLIRGDAALASRIYRDARGDWGAALRARVVGGKLELGELNAGTAHAGANVDNATRQAVKQIIRPNKWGTTIAEQIGSNPEEIAAMNRVSRGTTIGNTARWFGKLAPQGPHSIYAHGTAAALSGGLTAPVSAALFGAKKVGDWSTARHARQLDELVRSRSPLAQAMPRTMNNYRDTRAAAIARAYEGSRHGANDEDFATGGAVINDPNASPSERRYAGIERFANSDNRPMDEQILDMIPPVPGRADGGEVEGRPFGEGGGDAFDNALNYPPNTPTDEFPAANSVEWLQRRLPKAAGDWLGNAYAQGDRWSSEVSDPRKLAGEAISGAMSMLPARSTALQARPRVSVSDEVLAGRGNEPVKRFMVEQDGMKGRLHVTPEGVVRNSFLHPNLRGKGFGRSMYEAAIDHFGDREIPLRSDIGVSRDAARIYDSLKQRGYPVTRNSGTIGSSYAGLHQPVPGDSVFTVGLRRFIPPSDQR